MNNKLIALVLAMMSGSAMAFTMPSAPSLSNSGYDEIRTTDGAVCRSSTGGNLTLHGGFSDSQGDYNNGYYDNNDGFDNEQGAYIGFAYNFGGGKRIDCSRLAEIEFQKAELELQKLRAEIDALEQLKALHALQSSGELPPLSKN